MAIALAVIASIATQTQPEFSGRWILESPAPPADAVRVLVVEQPITRTNVRGEPMAPAFLRISIQRERASATSRDAHEIGIIGGTVGGGVSKTGADRGPSTRWETRWVADSLVFASATFDRDEPRTGKWAERVETWSLEPDGRLRWRSPPRVPIRLARRASFSTAANSGVKPEAGSW